jgi:hypothetical protein
MLLDKAFRALKSGWRIILYGYFLENDKRERSHGFLLSLQMQLAALHGNENSSEEMSLKL